MKRRNILSVLLVTTAVLAAPELAQAGDNVTSQPPAAAISQGPVARSSWHWGHWHIVRRHSRSRVRRIIRQLQDGADIQSIAAILVGVRYPPPGVSLAIGAVGYNRLARALQRALDRSRKEPAVRVDAGLRCYDVPYAPDPCHPWIQIRPRR